MKRPRHVWSRCGAVFVAAGVPVAEATTSMREFSITVTTPAVITPPMGKDTSRKYYSTIEVDTATEPRSLQGDATAACDQLLSMTYETAYEASHSPCSCQPILLSDGRNDGYQVTCSGYSYCMECALSSSATSAGPCAIRRAVHYYSNNLFFQRGSQCVDYTSGPATGSTQCFEFGRQDALDAAARSSSLSSTTGLFCTVLINDQECTRCDYALCSSTDNNNSNNNNVLPAMDCSNVQYTDGSGVSQPGINTNLCTVADGAIPMDSPFAAFRNDAFAFASCYSADTTSTVPTVAPKQSNIFATTATTTVSVFADQRKTDAPVSQYPSTKSPLSTIPTAAPFRLSASPETTVPSTEYAATDIPTENPADPSMLITTIITEPWTSSPTTKQSPATNRPSTTTPRTTLLPPNDAQQAAETGSGSGPDQSHWTNRPGPVVTSSAARLKSDWLVETSLLSMVACFLV
jgi:hypothetical protein